jgi:DNA-binding MarR family transcriptional regulator
MTNTTVAKTSTKTSTTSAPRSPRDTGELASRLRLAVTRLARRLRQETGDGVSPSLLAALATIERHGPATLGDIAAHEQVQPPTMTRIVASLVERGWVERLTDQDDRRIAWVEVTPEGRRLLARQRRLKDALLARGLRGVSSEELDVLERAAGILERLSGGPS